MIAKDRLGEVYMFGAAILWGLLPIVSKQAYLYIPILFCAAFSACVTALFFAVLLTVRGEWRELLCKSALKSSLIAGVGIGVLFYGLVFWGQSMVPASTTSVLLLMEVFFSMLLLRIVGNERLTRRQVMGASVMVVGAIIVLSPDSMDAFGLGELILLLAAAIPPIANYHMQKARTLVGVSSILFLRSVISCAVLLGVSLSLEAWPSADSLWSALPWVLVNGVLVLGVSKLLWVEAIRFIPISKAVAMNSLAPLVTLSVAFWWLNEPATWYQWFGCLPLTLGCWLLVSNRSAVRSHKVNPVSR